MGKQSRTTKGPRALNPSDAKIRSIGTWQDVADEEDEFHMNRDEVSLEGGPTQKRQLDQDGFSEESDEEVLRLEELPSSDDEEEDDDDEEAYGADQADADNDDDVYDDKSIEEDVDASGWGKSKRDYYDADDIEDEADAKEEEVEARRLQAKQLASLSAADFVFDEGDWKEKDDDDDDLEQKERDEVILTSVDVHASPEEQKKLLNIIYPEFQLLSDEFLELEPELKEMSERVGLKSSATLKTKFTVLSTYMGVLSMYFALLTVSRPEGELSNVKDHSIMDSLLKCRQAWLNVAEDEESEDEIVTTKMLTNGTNRTHTTDSKIVKPKTNTEKAMRVERKRKRESDTTALSVEKRRAQRNAKAEASLADLDDLLNATPSTTSKKLTLSGKMSAPKSSDFGEEGHLDVDDAEAKAKRKKSLRFYTSQIVQKNDKRGRAARDAGGDMDVPHKEREKERKERLTAEAVRRGQQSAGDDLDDNDFDEEDIATGRDVRDEVAPDAELDPTLNAHTNEDEDYYNKIASLNSSSKTKKKLLHDAEKSGDRVVETEIIDPETGKRAIGYTIEKNKGLTPHRKKDVRNPRVKKRKKYEAAKKKLSSTKAVFKQPTGAYAGETTGIKTRLVKSVKFK